MDSRGHEQPESLEPMAGDLNNKVKPTAWEGKLPEGSWPPPSDGLFAAGFVPVECKAGDLVVSSYLNLSLVFVVY